MEPTEQEIAQQKYKENYTMGIKKPMSFVFEVPENKHGIDNKVQDLNVSKSIISGNITFDGSIIVSPPVVVTLQNLDGVMALQSAATLTATQLTFAGSTGLLVQDADLTFVTDTLFVPKVNRVTITTPATGSTLTIANGFTLTVNGSTTLTNGTHSGTNTGDQTSIVGITGTKAQFDTSVTDGNFLYVGDVSQYTDEMAQDAVGGMVDASLTYVDGTPSLAVTSTYKRKSLFDSFADVSVGGAETDIYTHTTAASQLANNGEKIVSEYGGNFVTVGTELTQLKVYFGGTAIWDSTGVAPTTGTTSWRVFCEIIRVSSTVIRFSVSLNTTGASGFVYCTVGELAGLTLSGTNILKVTGTSSGVGSGVGDIVGKMAYVEWKAAG